MRTVEMNLSVGAMLSADVTVQERLSAGIDAERANRIPDRLPV
jgi:hypothetical protein